jgi:hypothetical protein
VFLKGKINPELWYWFGFVIGEMSKQRTGNNYKGGTF